MVGKIKPSSLAFFEGYIDIAAASLYNNAYTFYASSQKYMHLLDNNTRRSFEGHIATYVYIHKSIHKNETRYRVLLRYSNICV